MRYEVDIGKPIDIRACSSLENSDQTAHTARVYFTIVYSLIARREEGLCVFYDINPMTDPHPASSICPRKQ